MLTAIKSKAFPFSENDNVKVPEIYQYQILPAGSIMPHGWMKEQLSRDLIEGYIGHFDHVHPTVTHNVFINQDRLSKRKFTLRKEWWSGEHEGYWKDAVIRMAFLTNNTAYINRAGDWIDEIINNAGKDGYIGIYRDCDEPDCRFQHVRGNGELWTTSRIAMAMLAYYEFTGKEYVLEAVEKATRLVMREYADKNYFSNSSKGGGTSHGVGFFEILEWLYRITGEKDYADFSLKLYTDFNNGEFRDVDLKTQHLLDTARLFRDHGAHIAEGIFVPRYIAKLKNDEKFTRAADNAIHKMEQHFTPGGAMRADEWIKGRKGTADERYEYCGITEMVSPFNKLISFTGKMDLADDIETMTFNAGQGARFPVLTALTYLTKDNRFHINHRELVKRENYDAAHMAAACCVLNGGRLMPYYVEGMWMKGQDNNSLAAMLYGPNVVKTTLQGVPVQIEEETNYPFSDEVIFKVNPEKKAKFTLIFRKPFKCEQVEIEAPKNAKVIENENQIEITNLWRAGDEVKLDFNFSIRKIPQPASKTVRNKGAFIKRGPLVYAKAFKHRVDTVKEHQNSGFHRYKVKNTGTDKRNLLIDSEAKFEFVAKKPGLHPWENPPVHLTGTLYEKDGSPVDVSLVPMGSTVFRRVTFSETINNK